jgi:hypothetical protein
MSNSITPIDISHMPELLDLVEEVGLFAKFEANV